MPRTTRINKSRTPSDEEGKDELTSKTGGSFDDAIERETAISEQDQVDIDKISGILTDNGLTGGKIRLQRRRPEETQLQYLTTVPVDQFDLDWIKQVYGGGDYKAQSFRSNGQMYKPFTFSIDYSARGSMDERSSGPKQVQFQKDPIDQARQIAEMIGSSSKNSDQGAMLMKLMETSRTDAQNQMNMMVTMLTKSSETQAQIMAAAMQNNRSNTDWPALLAAVSPVLIKLLDKPGSGGGTNISDIIAAVKDLKGLADDKPEEDDGGMVTQIIKGLGSMMGPRPMLPPSRPQQAPPASNGEQKHRQPDPLEEQRKQMVMYVNMLLDGASRNADPGLYCDLIYTHLDEAALTQLVAMCNRTDWMQTLFNNDPRVTQHYEWFNTLRLMILEVASGDQQPQEENADHSTTQDSRQPPRPGDEENDNSTATAGVAESGPPDPTAG